MSNARITHRTETLARTASNTIEKRVVIRTTHTDAPSNLEVYAVDADGLESFIGTLGARPTIERLDLVAAFREDFRACHPFGRTW